MHVCTDVLVQEAPDSWYLRGVVAPDDHLQPSDLDLGTLGGEQPGVRPAETLHHLYTHHTHHIHVIFTLFTQPGVRPSQAPPITSIYLKWADILKYIFLTFYLFFKNNPFSHLVFVLKKHLF